MSEIESGSGVYGIVRAGAIVYIGSSVCMRKRRNGHKSSLRRGQHINPHLQSSWNLHGEKAFRFVCVERCPAIELLEREQTWLDKLWGDGSQLFNVFRQAYAVTGTNHPMFGRSHTATAKKKIGDRRNEQTIMHSAATRAKIGAKSAGRKLSEVSRQKLSKSKLGSAAWNKGLSAADPRVASHCLPRSTVAMEQGPVVLQRYATGESIESLRRLLGCSWDTVERFLRESGMTIRSIGDQKRIRDAAQRAHVAVAGLPDGSL